MEQETWAERFKHGMDEAQQPQPGWKLPERPVQPKTRVVHVRDQVPGAVYIGRAMPRQGIKGSIWGNIYRIGKDGTREEVIAKYRAWLLTQPHLLERLPELRYKALSCWCRPEKCHGDVLIALLEQLYPAQEESK